LFYLNLLRICQLCGVNTVAFVETIYVFADCRDRACAIGAKHLWESWFGPHNFDKSALALEWIPRADAGSFDSNQNLVRFDLRYE
jgi:hypothetical protein